MSYTISHWPITLEHIRTQWHLSPRAYNGTDEILLSVMLYMAYSNEDTILGQKLWLAFAGKHVVPWITAILFLGIWLASWMTGNMWAGSQISGRQRNKPLFFSSRLWPPKRQTGWSSVPHHTSFQKSEGLFYLWTSVWILVVSLWALPRVQCLGKSCSQK